MQGMRIFEQLKEDMEVLCDGMVEVIFGYNKELERGRPGGLDNVHC